MYYIQFQPPRQRFVAKIWTFNIFLNSEVWQQRAKEDAETADEGIFMSGLNPSSGESTMKVPELANKQQMENMKKQANTGRKASIFYLH